MLDSFIIKITLKAYFWRKKILFLCTECCYGRYFITLQNLYTTLGITTFIIFIWEAYVYYRIYDRKLCFTSMTVYPTIYTSPNENFEY